MSNNMQGKLHAEMNTKQQQHRKTLSFEDFYSLFGATKQASQEAVYLKLIILS